MAMKLARRSSLRGEKNVSFCFLVPCFLINKRVRGNKYWNVELASWHNSEWWWDANFVALVGKDTTLVLLWSLLLFFLFFLHK